MKRLAAVAVLLAMSACAATRTPPALPTSPAVTRDQLVVFADFRLAHHHRLLDDLAALREDIATTLMLPRSDEPIYVYLFDSSQRYQEYLDTHYAGFPQRRAFFVESDTRLSVYAYWGDRIAEDLRHETAHGYLHAAVRNLPLWLDEGLAEYFEVPRGRDGLNAPHVELLLESIRDGWRPNLEHLETLQLAEEMKQIHYAESWAWAHWMLHSDPARREMLQGYLARLRVTGAAPPLASVLAIQGIDPGASLAAHLQSLAE